MFSDACTLLLYSAQVLVSRYIPALDVGNISPPILDQIKTACQLVRALVISWLSVLSIGYVFSRLCHKCQPFLRLKQASYFPIYAFKFLPPLSMGSGFFSFRGSHWWHVFSRFNTRAMFSRLSVDIFPALLDVKRPRLPLVARVPAPDASYTCSRAWHMSCFPAH